MRLKKYITFDQLYYWSQTTAPFTFNGVQVNPATQMYTVEQILLPFLNGSLDNPYSTTTPKEKLPQYFTVAGDIGNYLNEEFGDRLVASSYRGGEYYAAIGRNLNNDEAMEVILQELISKTYHFISIYGYQFIKLFGTASINYNPIWNVDGTETRTTDYGQHITTDQHGNKQQTQTLGPTSKSNTYGQAQKTTQYGATSQSTQYGEATLTDSYGKHEEDVTYGTHTDSTQYGQVQTTNSYGQRTATHSETQMNDLTFKNKSQDVNSAVIDNQTVAQHTDSATFGTHTDSKTIKAKSDTHTQAQHTDTTTGTTHTDTVTDAQRIDSETTTTVTNTIADATYTDTNTSNQHRDVEVLERHGNIGVTSTQNLIMQERQILDWNPALEFFKAYTDKIMLRCYGY